MLCYACMYLGISSHWIGSPRMSIEKTIHIPMVLCFLWVSAWAQEESVSSRPGARFVDIAAEAGLGDFVCYSGGIERKETILETTGAGCAFLDYDNDGDLDIFLMTASRSEGFAEGAEPSNRLYRNDGNGRFSDVTGQAGLVRSGWGQGVCAGDYDNDGWIDLYLTYYGHNVLYRNTGEGSFMEVTRKAGLYTKQRLWGVGCSFLDYDRDSDLDLFVTNYIDFDPVSAPRPGENSNCLWKGIPVMCGPRGLKGLPSNLYRNEGDGTFADVSGPAGITAAGERYGLGVLVADYDSDGWPDVYVACDSTPNLLFRNNRDGTFSEMGLLAGVAYSGDGKEQAGMGVDAGDYDNDGDLDIVKTNFSDDKSSLYKNHGDGTFSDATFEAGLGVNLAYLGWGVGFLDYDQDGFDDIFIANGHVYPEIDGHGFRSRYRQRKVLYRNTGRSTFVDVTGVVRSGSASATDQPGDCSRRLRQRWGARNPGEQRKREAQSLQELRATWELDRNTGHRQPLEPECDRYARLGSLGRRTKTDQRSAQWRNLRFTERLATAFRLGDRKKDGSGSPMARWVSGKVRRGCSQSVSHHQGRHGN